jgi:hypothetical protein
MAGSAQPHQIPRSARNDRVRGRSVCHSEEQSDEESGEVEDGSPPRRQIPRYARNDNVQRRPNGAHPRAAGT